MTLEYAILGFLDRESMTGYDLKTRCFDDAVGHVWTADQAQIYRTLDRLQTRGLVRSRLVPQRGKPDRRVFSITPRGSSELAAQLRGPCEIAPVRDPLLLRLALSDGLSDEDLTTLLGEARAAYQARLDSLRSLAGAPASRSAATGARGEELFRMTLAAAMSAARTTIDWIDDCSDRIEGGLPPAGRRPDGGS